MSKPQLIRPNIKTNNIALLYSEFNKTNYEDSAFKEIIDLLNDKIISLDFNYAIYCDTHFVKEHIFLPIFHTYYLNCDKKHVVILSPEMYEIIELYPFHSYYLYGDKEKTKEDYETLKETYKNVSIKQITNIKEILDDTVQQAV